MSIHGEISWMYGTTGWLLGFGVGVLIAIAIVVTITLVERHADRKDALERVAWRAAQEERRLDRQALVLAIAEAKAAGDEYLVELLGQQLGPPLPRVPMLPPDYDER